MLGQGGNLVGFRSSAQVQTSTTEGSLMQYATYILGVFAATLTSLSYLPQVKKAIPRGSTSDLSLKMLVALSTGLSLWVLYGLLKEDWVIMLANMVGATLALVVLGLKVRDSYL
jgi:MtN3 and saliva related transmembrane protein